MHFIFATHNAGKAREGKALFEGTHHTMQTLADIGFTEEIPETGTTFAENALQKATFVYEKWAAQCPDALVLLADDSGLEVDALDGQPGVYSARFLGRNTPYANKKKAILAALDGVPTLGRSARFVCAMACCWRPAPGAPLCTLVVQDTLEGRIADAPHGEGGFGYDPIFWLPSHEKTLAQISAQEKNAISHRAKALRQLKAKWQEVTTWPHS